MTFARRGFQAQVPPGVPVDTDVVVVLSGAAEIALGGNISQYRNRLDGLGLNTDRKRFIRLFFQPLMCAVALHGGGLLPRSKRLR